MKYFLIMLFLIAFFITKGNETLLANDSYNVKILATSDISGYILNYDYYKNNVSSYLGLNRLITIIEKYRLGDYSNAILVDNGGFFYGSPLSEYISNKVDKSGHRHPFTRIMETLRYDVVNIGNSDINHSLSNMNDIINETKLQFTNSNLYKKNGITRIFNPYVIVEKSIVSREGVISKIKVAFIGAMSSDLFNTRMKDSSYNNLIAKDELSEINKISERLKKDKKADLVGVLLQPSIAENSNAKGLITNIARNPNVDFIISGNSNIAFPVVQNTYLIEDKTKLVEGKAVVVIPSMGRSLGVISFDLEKGEKNWEIKKIIVRNENTSEKSSILDKIVGKEDQEIRKYLKESIASVEGGLNNYFSMLGSNSVANVISKAVVGKVKESIEKEYSEYKDIPIITSIYSKRGSDITKANEFVNINEGKIEIRDVFNMYSYPEKLVVLKVTGRELKEYLEWNYQFYNSIKGNIGSMELLVRGDSITYSFDTILGVTYSINLVNKSKYNGFNILSDGSSRIYNLRYYGKEVNEEDIFLLAMSDTQAFNNAIINKDENNIIIKTDTLIRDILIDYITKQKIISGLGSNNWFLNMPYGSRVNFKSSIDAVVYMNLIGNKLQFMQRDGDIRVGIYQYKNQ